MVALDNSKIIAALRKIAAESKGTVQAGFFSEDSTNYPDGKNVPAVAFDNEFGVPEKNQPPRPFFRHTIEENIESWRSLMDEAMLAAELNAADALDIVGYEMRKDIVKSIDTLTDPPLAAYTVAKKGHAKPLIDTGKMRESVNYKVIK